jgi:hypothetical protein
MVGNGVLTLTTPARYLLKKIAPCTNLHEFDTFSVKIVQSLRIFIEPNAVNEIAPSLDVSYPLSDLGALQGLLGLA